MDTDDNRSSPDAITEPHPAIKLEKKNSPSVRSTIVQRMVWLAVLLIVLMILSLAMAFLRNLVAIDNPSVSQGDPTALASVPTSQPTFTVTATHAAATATPTPATPRPTARPTVLPTATPIPDDPYNFAYFLGSNGHIYGRGQSGKLYDLGGSMTTPPRTTIYSGRLFVFAKGIDNSLHYKVWDGTWSAWSWLGGTIQDNDVSIIQFNGRLHVFMLSSADNWIWEVAYDGSSWSPAPAGQWKPLGGKYTAGPIAAVEGTNLTVTAYDSNGHVYRATSSDGVEWSSFVEQAA